MSERRDGQAKQDEQCRLDGCSFETLHPGFASCATCPMPRCRYDMPNRDGIQIAQAIGVARLARQGQTAEAIAAALGISARQVWRVTRAIALARLCLGMLVPTVSLGRLSGGNLTTITHDVARYALLLADPRLLRQMEAEVVDAEP